MPRRPWIDYDAYIVSAAWYRRRAKYLSKHPNCERCGRRVNLQVHHKSYASLGREIDAHLMTVCRECHKAIHGLPNKAPQPLSKDAPVRKKKRGKRDRYWKIRKAGVVGSNRIIKKPKGS